MGKNEKKTSFILILFLISVPFVSGLAYKYRHELRISEKISDIKDSLFSSGNIQFKFDLIASVNDKDLRIKFSIPCKTMSEKQHLTRKLYIIKHEMLMSLDNMDNIYSVNKRDFKRIKANCLRVISKYCEVDSDNAYVEFFAHN